MNPLDQGDRSCSPSRATSPANSDPDVKDKSSSFSAEHPVTIPPLLIKSPSADESIIKQTKFADEAPKVTSPQSTVPELTKGVNFTNIFGATKKVLFRTTQNIIDNHERKNVLKAKNAAAAAAAAASEATSNTIDKKSPKHTNEISPTLSPVPGSCSPSSTGSTTPTTAIASLNLDQRKNQHYDDCDEHGPARRDGPPNVDDDGSKSTSMALSSDKCQNGLLRFLESPIFNVHFALHYLFYSKEPGVLSFIGNKIFSFRDPDVDLYIPQLILMYIQMNELAEVLDPYLVYRCRKAVDFCLKCLWLLESYNYNADSFFQNSCDKKIHLRLMRQIYPINEKHHQQHAMCNGGELKEILDNFPAIVKTHHR